MAEKTGYRTTSEGKAICDGDRLRGIIQGEIEYGQVMWLGGEWVLECGYPKWQPALWEFDELEKVK